MPTTLDTYRDTSKLEERYKKLVEKAYNFKQTNSTLSDLAAFKAMKLLEKINRIKFGY
ncbi:MAG: Lacal_2735 family protein [Flavobacteriaceae bacterium]